MIPMLRRSALLLALPLALSACDKETATQGADPGQVGSPGTELEFAL